MTVDLLAARDFMATHARVLDRRRFDLLDGETDPSGALAALDGYRNPDGGYGWGLEADHTGSHQARSPSSVTTAGATTMRTISTSIRIATPRRRPTPIGHPRSPVSLVPVTTVTSIGTLRLSSRAAL
jgi:hypothetical protein